MEDIVMEESTVSTKEAAKIVGHHRRTITSWIHRGWLPAAKGPGPKGRYKIKYSDLMKVANRPYQPEGEPSE